MMMYDDFGMYGGMEGAAQMGDYGGVADSIAIMFMSLYLLLLGAILIGGIADYLLRGFGMYKMGKAEGRSNCWLAFVPFARTYFQGELSGEIKFKERSIKNPGLWLILVPIIANVVMAIGYFIIMIVTMMGAITSDGYVADGSAAGLVSGFIVFFIIALILGIAYQAFISILYVLVNHQIYGKYTSKNMAIVHAVLGTLIPLYQSICMFIMGRRAEQESEEAMYGQQDYQNSSYQEPVYREPVYQNPVPREVEETPEEDSTDTQAGELPVEKPEEKSE